jgi:hypothetical protein
MIEKKPFLSRAADAFCLILGLTTVFAVHFVGDLYLAEILLALALPILLVMRGQRALHPQLKLIYILMAIWLLGLVIADAYNQIPIVDRLRGMALIVFFGLNIFGMSILLSRNEKRKILYLVGLAVGALASVRLQPTQVAHDYPWKFGYAFGTMQVVLLISAIFYARRRYVISALFILGICGVNLILNFRSPVLDLLMTVAMVYPIIPDRIGNIQILPQSQVVRLIVLALFAMAAAGVAKGMVDFVTRAGYVNEESQAKNEAQSKGGNLLFGGRPEFLIGLRAALDRPIIGHGSWAKDLKYFEMLYDLTVETGSRKEQTGGDISAEADGLIPAHSHIIAAWVWAGIAGLVFWLYMIWFVLQGIGVVALLRPALAPVYMWFLISMFWDILFSPFAATRRMTEAVMIVIVADLLRRKPRQSSTGWHRMGVAHYQMVTAPFNKPIVPRRLR